MFHVETLEDSEYDFRIWLAIGPYKTVKYLGKITESGEVVWSDTEHEPVSIKSLSRLIIDLVFKKFSDSYIRIGRTGVNLKSVTIHELDLDKKDNKNG